MHVVDEILINLTWRVLELVGYHALVGRHKDLISLLKDVGAQSHLWGTDITPNLIKLLFQTHRLAVWAHVESVL